MERARYIRFKSGVMSPGRGANIISKAYSKSSQTVPPDELMDAIEVTDAWVTLRRFRRSAGKIMKDDHDQPIEDVRKLPREKVEDFEPERDDEPQPPLRKETKR